MTTNIKPTSPSKFSNKRSPSQRDNDLQSVARMSLQGMVEVAITDELNRTNCYQLSRSQVHQDLAALRKFWAEKAIADTAEQCGLELAKLNLTEQVAWEAFNKSHEAQWLGLVLKASAQRVSLLGLSRPERLELSGTDGQPFQFAQLIVPPRGKLDRDA